MFSQLDADDRLNGSDLVFPTMGQFLHRKLAELFLVLKTLGGTPEIIRSKNDGRRDEHKNNKGELVSIIQERKAVSRKHKQPPSRHATCQRHQHTRSHATKQGA